MTFSKITFIKNQILDLLFPVICVGCGQNAAFICTKCKNRYQMMPPSCFVCKKWVPVAKKVTAGRTCQLCRKNSSIYAFLSPFSYENKLIRDLIHSLKYQRARGIAPEFADLLVEYCHKFGVVFSKETLVIPIPLHKRRQRVRGFNQSAVIVYELSKRLSLTFAENLLIRRKYTTPQVELSGEERRQNIIDSFWVTNPEVIKEKEVLLVDDVKTTGATMGEAARVLKEAGANKVWGMTVAH